MTLLDLKATTSKLRFDPVEGRRTFYFSLTLCDRTFWLQRWYVRRAPTRWTFDGLMGWTWGYRTTRKAST